MYALVDANSFYCSAEQVFRPEWRGKPMVVLSNNDGCIVAATRQAQALGIKKFLPFFQQKSLCDNQGIIALSSNYELYADLSAKMMNVIGRFAPEQHVYSIDESFLSFHHSRYAIPDLAKQAMLIRRAVWKECRLPVCVGMASTLTLAKIANHAAKKMQGYNGVCVIDNDQQREYILKQMPVSSVWGIGRKTTKRLQSMGINCAFRLAKYPAALARKEFNVGVERTIRELNGTACNNWDAARADKKQVFSTRSMGKRIVDRDSLTQALSKHAAIAAAKIRQQGSLCRVMMIFASNSPHDDKPASFRVVHKFSYPTDDTVMFTQAISSKISQLFQQGVEYYKVGVGLIDLIDGRHAQFDLFDYSPPNSKLMRIFDGLNMKYGDDALFLAAQGINPKWGMRRNYLTPQYTTCWQDLPSVRC
ncbi:MAG: Y-family DNA polymerase [Aliivibrio sp.]|uniref:Y-family DNA polymerase n=1 Tax=Aliivibrio sp. TaxID=1872443 RepID=UPI001A399D0F|nr:Y-family DNA polymerase [Aliivibrio sp.]